MKTSLLFKSVKIVAKGKICKAVKPITLTHDWSSKLTPQIIIF